jgi:hypothetical protein
MKTAPESDPTDIEDDDPVRKCASMSRTEFCIYMNELGTARRFEDLRKVYSSDVTDAPFAAFVCVREMESDKGRALCDSLVLGSATWRNAVAGLAHHDREEVIAYFRNLSHSNQDSARAIVYALCDSNDWFDEEILDSARADRSSTFPLVGPCYQIGETLGTVASSFVAHRPVEK